MDFQTLVLDGDPVVRAHVARLRAVFIRRRWIPNRFWRRVYGALGYSLLIFRATVLGAVSNVFGGGLDANEMQISRFFAAFARKPRLRQSRRVIG